jgi:hypothetical protein
VEILEHSSPGKVFVAMDRRLDGAATGPRWLHFELMDERVAQVVADALGFGERRSTGLPFWQDESYDHWVRGPEELAKIVRYIEENPVVAGLVSRGEDWRWSSAFGMAQGQARRPGQEARPGGRSHLNEQCWL